MITPEILSLKVGGKVILTSNSEDLEYVNGSIGIVKSLHHKCLEVIFNDGIESRLFEKEWDEYGGINIVNTFKQILLKLAYAVTIHKS